MATTNPIYIFHPGVQERGAYAVHPRDAEENAERLKEYGVKESRIHMVNAVELVTRLETGMKAVLIIPGGYTPLLSKVLKGAYPAIWQAVKAGILTGIWGQCAGANVLCERMIATQKKADVECLGLVPANADTDVYPVPAGAKVFSDHYRIVPIFSAGMEHLSFFNRGSKLSLNETNKTTRQVTVLARYLNIEEGSAISAVSTKYPSGSTIVASGDHPEFVEVGVPGFADILGGGKNENLKKHIASIYEMIGIQPNRIASRL